MLSYLDMNDSWHADVRRHIGCRQDGGPKVKQDRKKSSNFVGYWLTFILQIMTAFSDLILMMSGNEVVIKYPILENF